MSEPHRPATNDEEEPASTTAKSAEDRKAASALASLDANDTPASAAPSNTDSEAVNQAIKNLSGGGDAKASSKASSAAPAAPKVAVKVDQADVSLLVEHLEVSKVKATEMLRAAGGQVRKVLVDFVTAV